MIKISYVIPMYNAEKYIGACIESIFDQGFDNDEFEIIVIDDGSKDNGKEIVAKYPDVIYFFQQNQGQSAARNKGLDMAKGQYVCFVDADDLLVPNSIKYCLDAAIENNLDILTYDMVRCNETEIATKKIVNQDAAVQNITNGVQYLEDNNYNNGPWWYITKRDVIGDLRFVVGRYGEDGMFTMELLMKVDRIAHIDRKCYYYMVRQGSTTISREQSHMKKMIDDYMFVYHYMQNLIKSNKEKLTSKAYMRCDERSRTYLFFMMARLLKFPHASSLIDQTVTQMKSEGIYPINRPDERLYSGRQYSIVTFICNRTWLLKLCNYLYSINK